MRKHHITLIIAACLLIAISIGFTVALLIASSNTVVNVFTIGNVSITLNETTGEKYVMAPGVSIAKDPTVTVRANSEECWLFVKVEKENDFDAFCEYEIASGWSTLDGYEGVFFRTVSHSSSDRSFSVLNDNVILVLDSVTEGQLSSVTNNPRLKITAYAAQKSGVASEKEAWKAFDR